MSDRLERFMNLIAKTGDKVIIYDRHDPDKSFVISSLNDYEELLKEAQTVQGLTEDELIDKINRDIALWKSGQVNDPDPVEMPPLPTVETEVREKKSKGNVWSIPSSRRREDTPI